MAKRKKKMKNADEKNVEKNELAKQIEKITAGLYYVSETDAEIYPFTGTKAEAVTAEELLKQTGNSSEKNVEERDFAGFFAFLIKEQDWFGEEETAVAKKFAELKELLETNLKDLKVLKVGRIELDVYVIGLDDDSNLTGIKTKAVET